MITHSDIRLMEDVYNRQITKGVWWSGYTTPGFFSNQIHDAKFFPKDENNKKHHVYVRTSRFIFTSPLEDLNLLDVEQLIKYFRKIYVLNQT